MTLKFDSLVYFSNFICGTVHKTYSHHPVSIDSCVLKSTILTKTDKFCQKSEGRWNQVLPRNQWYKIKQSPECFCSRQHLTRFDLKRECSRNRKPLPKAPEIIVFFYSRNNEKVLAVIGFFPLKLSTSTEGKIS